MEAFEQVHRLVQEGLEQGAYPSAALAVGIGARVYRKSVYGNCTENTLFDMASLSKILGATMIAFRFLEDGLLHLTDTVGSFFPDAPADKANITVLQLMTHTGGFTPKFYLFDYISDPADAAKAILQYPLDRAPGTAPDYSCMGYILLGKILERIGGAPLDVLAKTLVFDPLGMQHTTYRPSGDIAPTERDPKTGEPFRGTVHDKNGRFLRGISGNAGVFSNIDDMIRFVSMLSMDGRLPDGSAYLSADTLRAARINRTPDSKGEFRGLGFNLAGSPDSFLSDGMGPNAYGHTGFTGTSIALDPDTRLWVVLLTNRVCPTCENTKLLPLRPRIHDAAAEEARRILNTGSAFA